MCDSFSHLNYHGSRPRHRKAIGEICTARFHICITLIDFNYFSKTSHDLLDCLNLPELCIGTISIGAIHFILAILTIPIEIANPVPWNAFVIVATKGTRLAFDLIAVSLVGMVTAIIVTIAFPKFGNAHTTVTSELIGSTTVGNSWAGRIGKWFDSTRTHALAILHYHTIWAETDELIVWRTETNVRTSCVVCALIRSGLNTVSKYFEIHQTS